MKTENYPILIKEKMIKTLIHRQKNALVLGSAGTGKSSAINEIVKKYYDKNKILLCAVTGTAAERINGYTLNRLFCIDIHRQCFPILETYRRKIQEARLLIIDEISMCSCFFLNQIDSICRKIRHNRKIPFGGMKVIMFGDSKQLPPVPNKDVDEERNRSGNEIAFYKAHVFSNIHTFDVFRLTHIWRQTDPAFQALLERMRDENITAFDLKTINKNYSATINPDPNSISLTTTNKDADLINRKIVYGRRKKVYEIETIFQIGEQNENMARLLFDHRIPEKVYFSIGSPVIFYRNDRTSGTMRWTNGTMGTVVAVKKNESGIRLVSIELQDGKRIAVERERFPLEIKDIAGKYTIIDYAEQFPFKAAYAITIHKSQGMTFDKKVKIVLGNTIAPNLVYVALSRAVSLEQIYIEGRKITRDALRMSDDFSVYVTERYWMIQPVS